MMNLPTSPIARLNDTFRQALPFGRGGRVVMTSGIAALPNDVRGRLLMAVRTFDAFTPDNDPHEEHDFGSVTVDDSKAFWKIDYFESAECEFGAEFPGDPSKSYRVLTFMLATEY